MTVVVKLGGTNGSGKTSVARALIYSMVGARVHGDPPRTSGAIYQKWWCVLGSYRNACGGMDTISDKNVRLKMVREQIEYSDGDDVIFFEGLITGKTYGAFGAMSEERPRNSRWIYAFMDTPFDVCVSRVNARRQAAAKVKGLACPPPLDATRTMLPTYKAVQSTAQRAAAAGHKVLWLPHNHTPGFIAEILIKEVEKVKYAC